MFFITRERSKRWAVVVVPFPFTDRMARRKRPTVVLSRPQESGSLVGQSVLAMIASAVHRSWPLDVPITDLAMAGIPAPSVVRMKLFTLDDRLVQRQVGTLAAPDAVAAGESLARLLAARR